MPFLGESQRHTIQDIGELLLELHQLIDAQSKSIAKFGQQSLTEEASNSLDARSPQQPTWHTRPPDVQPTTSQESAGRWCPPPSLTVADITSLEALEAQPYMRTEAPLFNGDDPLGWIFGIQAYFNYFFTDESVRLAVVEKLIEQPASDWFYHYQQTNVDGSWEDFLVAVRHHFAPKLTEVALELPKEISQTLASSTKFSSVSVLETMDSCPQKENFLAYDDKVDKENSVANDKENYVVFEGKDGDIDGPSRQPAAFVIGESKVVAATYLLHDAFSGVVVDHGVSPPVESATPTPSYSEAMASCPSQLNLISNDDRELYDMERATMHNLLPAIAASTDARSIPPRDIAFHKYSSKGGKPPSFQGNKTVSDLHPKLGANVNPFGSQWDAGGAELSMHYGNPSEFIVDDYADTAFDCATMYPKMDSCIIFPCYFVDDVTVKKFSWKEVVIGYEDSNYGSGFIHYLRTRLLQSNALVLHRSVISSIEDQICLELTKLVTMQGVPGVKASVPESDDLVNFEKRKEAFVSPLITYTTNVIYGSQRCSNLHRSAPTKSPRHLVPETRDVVDRLWCSYTILVTTQWLHMFSTLFVAIMAFDLRTCRILWEGELIGTPRYRRPHHTNQPCSPTGSMPSPRSPAQRQQPAGPCSLEQQPRATTSQAQPIEAARPRYQISRTNV